MENKDIIIGVLLIAVVGLAGALGFVLIINTFGDQEPTEPAYLQGLPDDWTTAPNSSSFTLYDIYAVEHIITLGDILEGVQEYLDDPETEWKQTNELITIRDPITNQYLTGINILDILVRKGIYFARDLEFKSSGSAKLDIHTGEIITKNYAKRGKTYFVLVLAVNKTWLHDSNYYSTFGNFSIMGLDSTDNLYNLNSVSVLTNWTIDVKVNGFTELSLGPWNLTHNPFTANYSFENTYGWGANRQYWGLNISEILRWTSADIQPDYNVTFKAADGFETPFWKWEPPYNKSEVENGIYNNGTHVIPRSDDDYVNGTDSYLGIPMPASDLVMNLAWKIQEFGETYGGFQDNPWPVPKLLGYKDGPFNVQIPGRNRANYPKWVKEIIIEY